MDSWLNVAGQSTFQCNFQIAHQIKTPMSHLLYSRPSTVPFSRFIVDIRRLRIAPDIDLCLIAVLGVALEVFRGETFRQPSFPGELLANERRRDTICRWSPHVSGLDKIFLGERGGTRTLDPMIKSHVLYHLSYALTCRAV
jgi:hypothetical protein